MVSIVFYIHVVIVGEIKYLGHPRREALLLLHIEFNRDLSAILSDDVTCDTICLQMSMLISCMTGLGVSDNFHQNNCITCRRFLHKGYI